MRQWMLKNNPFRGKKHTPETIKRMRIINKKKAIKGENHYNWKGGTSREPYSIDWRNTLKRSIRERDKYTCQLCGKQQEDIAFCVHHIDYDKKNCSPDNLITLCYKCHSKTNHNREYWIKYFQSNRV